MFSFIEDETYTIINIFAFIIGLLFGVIAQKNQFCFSGSIKDYFLTSSTKRAASVVVAMISAIAFTQIIAYIYNIDLMKSYYFQDNTNYFSIILGGLLFGIGMMIADGCASRSLVKFAQGDIKALVTLVFVAIFALATKKGFLYEISIFLTSNFTLVSISSYIDNFQINIFIILLVLFVILYLFTKKFKHLLELYDGVIIGLLIATAWLVSSIGVTESLEKTINLSSISFVYPNAKILEIIAFYKIDNFSFGVSVVFGVLVGAFLMSKKNKKYSFGCTSHNKKSNIKNNILGGALMGTGGVLTLGCTVGQGLSGLSTLAFSSLLSISSILISGYFTAKYLDNKNLLPDCFMFEWKD